MSQSGTDFLTGSTVDPNLPLEAPLSTHASDSPFYHVADSHKPTSIPNDAPLSSSGSGLDLLSSNPSSSSRKGSGNGSPTQPPSSTSTIADMDFSSLNSNSSNLPHSSALAVITATSAAFLESAHPTSATLKNSRPEEHEDLPSSKDTSFSASDTSASVSEPSTPHQTKLTKRTSSTNNAIENVNTKLAAASPESVTSPSNAPIFAIAANGSMPKLNVNTSSSDNPDSSPPAAIASATTAATTTSAAATSSKSTNPTSAPSASTSSTNPAQSRGIFNRLFNPFGGGGGSGAAAPASAGSDSTKSSPPPTAGSAGNTSKDSTTGPPGGAPTPTPAGAAATAATTGNTLQQNPSPIPVVIPKSYSYQDFAAKMKLPAAQDLVKSLKNYVKLVQSPEWYAKNIPTPADGSQSQLASYGSEFDKIKAEYNEVIASIMKTIRVKHPLWKGCSEEELDNACESIEKFLTSKLYDKFFGLFQGDRTKDQALTQKLFVLHTWVQPSHLDLPPYCCADVSIWDHPAEELRNMDKFKSPRDKLVCLLNCCHIINNILKRAKVKANAEKAEAMETKRKQRQLEKERLEKEKANELAAAAAAAVATADPASTTAANTTPSQSPEASPKSSPTASLSKRNSLDDIFTPSSSPSADDFFPALLYVLVHAQAPHLYLNLVYISLCRFETKLSGGEAAYWYTNLASAIAFIESCNEKSFSFSKEKEKNATVAKKEYERLMEAGLVTWNELKAKEEADRKAAAEAEAAAAAAAEEKRKADKEAAANAEATAAAIAAAATAAASPSAHSDTSTSIDLLNSPAHLLHNHGGVSVNGVLPPPCVACLHLSHRRIPTHFLEREFSSLTMGEMQDVVREYKELIFVLQGWQEATSHREMKNMPLPTKGSSTNADESEFSVNLTGADANSAAPSNAAVAASSHGLPSKDPNLSSAATASQSRGWLTGNFLGLGRTAK